MTQNEAKAMNELLDYLMKWPCDQRINPKRPTSELAMDAASYLAHRAYETLDHGWCGDDVCRAWGDAEAFNEAMKDHHAELFPNTPFRSNAKSLDLMRSEIISLRKEPEGPPEEIETGLYRLASGEVVGGEPDGEMP